MDARRFQGGKARHGLLKDRREVIEVVGQLIEGKISRDAVQAPRLGDGLERAEQKLARVLLVVGALVGHAQHGHIARQTVHRLGDDVEVLAGLKRYANARHRADLAAPHASAINDRIGRDRAGVAVIRGPEHRAGAAPIRVDGGHANALVDRRAVLPSALG